MRNARLLLDVQFYVVSCLLSIYISKKSILTHRFTHLKFSLSWVVLNNANLIKN